MKIINRFFGLLQLLIVLLLTGCTSSDISKSIKSLGLDEIVTISDFNHRDSILIQAFGSGEDWITPGEEALAQKALQNNKDHEGTLWRNQYKGDLTIYPVATSESGRCRKYFIEYFVVSMGITKANVQNTACFDSVKKVWLPQTIKFVPSGGTGITPVLPVYK